VACVSQAFFQLDLLASLENTAAPRENMDALTGVD
jgi:hypothetical protein